MFQFPLTIHQNGFSGPYNAPAVKALTIRDPSANAAVILTEDDGPRSAGLYVFDGRAYRYAMSELEVSRSVIRGYDMAVYYGVTQNVTLGAGAVVFKNGVKQEGLVLTPGNAVYGVQIVTASPTGGVASINGQTGPIALSGAGGIDVNTVGANIEIIPGAMDEGTF